jgi:hypothetical protein
LFERKLWKVGVADQHWKRVVCLHDITRAEAALDFLAYVLTDSVDDLRLMTGAQIVDGLLHYRDVARKALENGDH